MKKVVQLLFLVFLFVGTDTLIAQYGYGNRYGRQRSTVPQAQSPPPEPEAKTAEQLVDEQMPKVIETLSLDPFEEAVVRSVFVKTVQKRMELQILNLEPQKMKEAFEKLQKEQDAELEAGLPPEKYEAYKDMIANPSKAKRKIKKKKKKDKKSKT